MERSARLLAEEIERTRRRVNTLEHVQIPTLGATIKSLSMKRTRTSAAAPPASS